MIKVVCDCCGQSMVKWLHVVTTPTAKEPWINVIDLIKYGTNRDMCEECYNKFLEGMFKDG